MSAMQSLGSLIGRILLALIFVMSGFLKIIAFNGTEGYMASAGIPHNLVLPALILTILIEFGCGILVLIGYKARLAAFLIFMWLIPVTLIFHFLPAQHGVNATVNQIMYMKNLSMMGGLLLVAAMGPGAWSIDGSGVRNGLTETRRAA
jgi:putative oxidoreductase